ncbi:MAG: aminotransferase class III [Candidatus Omnitrophica bacterium CG1_02_49_16]|nr:MAG: aminotransferase class III [Candidatus Omnitrophica bacterium CG1_02_49_16]
MKRSSKLKKGPALWKKAITLIPGGNQLLSKRSEMFLPDHWPSYYEKAKGVNVWDLDGRKLVDMSLMGVGSCVLGYANADVNAAVKKAIDKGNMTTLNCREEVELAEKLIELHPWARMVRFARTGGEACAVAVRIARVASGKDKVLFCGYHGWADWYLASNLSDIKNLEGQLLPGLDPKGVPQGLKGTAIPFHYGNLFEFEAKVQEHGKDVGVIIMEVERNKQVDLKFLKAIRHKATMLGAVLIFDEITSGFRMRVGGMHMLHGIEPDMLILGKAMGNGFPISSVVGRREVMRAAQGTFISSTYWTERVGFVAALEVIRQFKKKNVSAHLKECGEYLRQGFERIIVENNLNAEVCGTTPLPAISLKDEKALLIKTFFTQEMLKKGYLASTSVYLSYAHKRLLLERYLSDAAKVFSLIKKNMDAGKLEKSLEGPVCHSGFKRLA